LTAARERAMRAALRDIFGIASLRPGQRRVIERVMAGANTLALMPTGAGKSLCYQLPAVLLRGCTVVVSPLVALMKDQCEDLREKGIAACQLNSAVDSDEQREAQSAVQEGSARIVMVTPERLAEEEFIAALSAHPVALLVVDEAHCISQWGHDFRPAFLEIAHALERLHRPPVLALTATATEEVAQDIAQQLGIPDEGIVQTGSLRPNLELAAEQVVDEAMQLERIVSLVREHEGSGIVYAATVKAAQQVHDALAAKGESVGLYHGKLRAAERAQVQDEFMDGRRRVMVATNAFGLGIDKPDIRFVLHYQLPATLEAYYQEAGRAGRDGEAAECVLLYRRADKAVQTFFMAGRYPTQEDAQAAYTALLEPPPEGDGWTLPLLQGRTARPRGKLQVVLSLLKRERIVAQDASGIRLLRRDVQDRELARLMNAYRGKRESDREGLGRMVDYAQSGQCRWRLLLDHLEGASPFERCGHCDSCRRIAAQEEALALEAA
jgi:ATP-dependent DNA helicase RecQ